MFIASNIIVNRVSVYYNIAKAFGKTTPLG